MTVFFDQPDFGVAEEEKGMGTGARFRGAARESLGPYLAEDAESERQGGVENFYRTNLMSRTYDLVEMSIWECCELLNNDVDESDPDLEKSQIQHLLQTAEAIRKDYPNEDWLHLTGLIHDLGKVLLHPEFRALSQWAVVGGTFPVGCTFDESIMHHKYFDKNPDSSNSEYSTKYSMEFTRKNVG